MLMLYVDDLFLRGKEELIKDARRTVASEFDGIFLGMEVWKNEDGISLGQGKYVVEILKRFELLD